MKISSNQGAQQTTRMPPVLHNQNESGPQVESEGQHSGAFAVERQASLNLGLQRPELRHLTQEISAHMHNRQLLYIPHTMIIASHKSEACRVKLAEWIFELVDRLGLRADTGFLGVNIMDRVLGLREVPIRMLALLGVTALVMAAKYEQVLVPPIESLVRLVASHYQVTKDSVCKLESNILILLTFDLSFVSPIAFIAENCYRKKTPAAHLTEACLIARNLTISSPTYRYKTASQQASEALQYFQQNCI